MTTGDPQEPPQPDDEFGLDWDPCEHPSINGRECAGCGEMVDRIAERRGNRLTPKGPRMGESTGSPR